MGDAVRAGLLDPRELSVDHRASAAGARERKPRHHDRRDGLRGDTRTARARERRELHRPHHREAPPRERAGGGAGGERLRIGPHSAEFQERAVSGRTRQLDRKSGTLPHGYGRQQRERPDSAAREPAAPQRGRRRRGSDVCSLVALPRAARRQAHLCARLSHRVRRRQADAGVWNRGGNGMAHGRQLRGEVQAGRAPLLRVFRRLRRPWRDDPQRALLLRDRSDRQGQVGHPGPALPLGMVGARAAAGGTHAKDLRGNRRRHGRPDASWTGTGPGKSHRPRRLDHPRSRRRHDGIGPQDFGHESMVSDLGRAQPFHHRRRRVRIQRRQESDTDHPGPCLARGGPHPRADAAERAVIDRRTTVKWMLAASAAWPLLRRRAARAEASAVSVQGYGTDPNLLTVYHPGDLWPLTLTPDQRRLAAILADLIIPADESSPSASAAGVVEFIDEWVSAPYPRHQRDRGIVLDGFKWLDTEAIRRSGTAFAELGATDQHAICDEICDVSRAADAKRDAARFFALYRDVTAGGFYSTPVGRKDLGYIGNVPQARFDGPPPELLRKLNLP